MTAVTVVESGGIAVTAVESGAPLMKVVDGGGIAVTVVESGGIPFVLDGLEPPSEVPANLSLPVISGTPTVGQTLSTTNGTWSNSPSSYAYQWYDDDVEISGATSSSYELTASEEGGNITVGVTATNVVGASDEAVSEAVGPVESAPGEATLPAPVLAMVTDNVTFPPLVDIDVSDPEILTTDTLHFQVATDPAFSTLVIDTTAPVGTGDYDFGLAALTTEVKRWFRAWITRGAEYSVNSNVVTHGYTVPETISDLVATAQSYSEVLLEFTPAPSASGHEYRVDGGTAVACDDNSGSQLVTGLSASTEYDFEVRGTDGPNDGAWSNVATETTEALGGTPAAWATTVGVDRNQYTTLDGLTLTQAVDVGAACGVRADRPAATDTFSFEITIDGLSGAGSGRGVQVGVTGEAEVLGPTSYPTPGVGGANGSTFYVIQGDTTGTFFCNAASTAPTLPASDTVSVGDKIRVQVTKSTNSVAFYYTPSGGSEALVASATLTSDIPVGDYYAYAAVFRAGDSLTADFTGY